MSEQIYQYFNLPLFKGTTKVSIPLYAITFVFTSNSVLGTEVAVKEITTSLLKFFPESKYQFSYRICFHSQPGSCFITN